MTTLGELRTTVAQLIGTKAVTDSRRGAAHLLAGTLGMAVGEVMLAADRVLADGEVERALVAARQVAGGMPLAYATGVAAFRTLEVHVDSRVLIPRPETEGLVDRVLAWQVAAGPGGVAVDVGTGSGCIALSLAIEGRFDQVVGVDRSADALTVARQNGARLGVSVAWMVGDLLQPVGDLAPVVIVSNPPYIAETEWDLLPPDVRDHEPRMALVAADDGMAVIRQLTRQAFPLLRAGGLLAVEVDSTRPGRAQHCAREAGFDNISIEADLFGRPRYLLAIKE